LNDAPDDIAYTVLLGCRNPDTTRVAYEQADLPTRHVFKYLPLELSNLDSTNTFASAVLKELGEGKLATILLCAAISKSTSGEDQKTGKWSQAFIVNYAGMS
jgi:hypothetical protein